MKTLRVLVLTGLFGLFATGVNAGGFVALGGSLMSIGDEDDTLDPVNALFRLGYALNESIEVGGELNFTVIEDEELGLDWGVDTTFIYAQFNLQLRGGSKLYLMLGKTDAEFTASANGSSVSFEDLGTGIGFGIQIPAGSKSAFNIDYISYYDDDQFDGIPAATIIDGIAFTYKNFF